MNCLKRIISVLLVMCTLGFIMVIPTYADSEWPTLSSDAYLEMVSPMSVPVYEDRNLKTRGTFLPRNNPDASISSGDELTIIAITSTYTRVMYKSASRNCVGFVDTYTLLGTTSPKEVVQAKAKVNTYLGSSTNNRSGSTSIGDTVYKLGTTKNGYVMIIYTAKSDSRAYKCAFVSKNDYALITGDNGTTSSSDMVDVTSEFAGKTISLKSIENGKYLCADSSYSEIPAICNRDSVGDWEKFTVSSITSDGWVGLKATTNGKYLSAIIDSQDAPIRASASDLYSWECFRIFRKGSDYFLKAQANDKWLCVRVDLTNSPVQAYADTPLTWERFNICILDGSQESIVRNRLDDIANGNITYDSNTKMAVGETFSGTRSNEECKGYAKNVWKLTFGRLPGSTQSKPNNYLLNSTDGMTYLGSVTSQKEADIRSLFSQARPGDFVQIRRSHGGSHSAIVYALKDTNGDGIYDTVTFLEANANNDKNGIHFNDYTWSKLASKNAAISIYTATDYAIK